MPRVWRVRIPTRYASRLFTRVAGSFPAWRTTICSSASGSATESAGGVAESSDLGFAVDGEAEGAFFAGAFAGGAPEGEGVCRPHVGIVMENARKTNKSRGRDRIGGDCNPNWSPGLVKSGKRYATNLKYGTVGNKGWRYLKSSRTSTVWRSVSGRRRWPNSL